jgi:acyl transferase domain-containing protein/acyl carrier protein
MLSGQLPPGFVWRATQGQTQHGTNPMNPTSNPGESVTLSQRVLLALKETRSKLEEYERAKSEPIAIIGMGCRFPGGADNPELFWDLLCRGVDAIREVPADRWDVDAYYDPDPSTPGKTCIRSAGFLQRVDLFDGQFFGISPREARSLDPQQRLLLEVAWEAFENAGQGRDDLFGNKVGVFIGIGNVDYARLMHDEARSESIDLYSTTGNVFSAAAGRISYTLGLHGPSVSLDTACSSSLVSIHLACQSLRTGESVMTLAGGVNLILSPESMVAMSRVPGGLSPDGRCKTFDAAANGLARGEGCGLIVLKRLSDATRDRDHIIALIRGSAVNQDGRSAGLTVPNGQAQAALIEQALTNSRVSPDQVSYIETHGPGTALGDPIEAGALGTVFGRNSRERRLVVGSVKTNIGHLESAAGVAGLIKTALMVQHGEIPPNLHFSTPNPNIDWERIPIAIPTERVPFPATLQSVIAGVSSFGVSGTNAHAVLEEPPKDAIAENRNMPPKYLLTLSAKNEQALQEIVARYQTYFERQTHAPLLDVCYTASAGRFHFPHRLALAARSVDDLREQLTRASSSTAVSSPPRIGFLFPDFESVALNTDNELYTMCSVFRNTLDRLLPQSQHSYPTWFCFGYALAELWRSWGITPSVVTGRGIGEVLASCVAGIMNLDEALELSVAWGQLKDSDQSSEATLEKILSQVDFQKPRIPIVSLATGQRVGDEIAQVQYWVESFQATRSEVSLPDETVDVLLEAKPASAWEQSLEMLAKLYVAGATIKWDSVYQDLPCRRVPLPTYPFQKQRHWFEKKELRTESERVPTDPLGSLIYEEEWRPQLPSGPSTLPPSSIGTWLILADQTGIGSEAAAQLETSGNTCIIVLPGQSYDDTNEKAIRLDPTSADDFDRLITGVSEQGLPLRGIIHLWGIDANVDGPSSLPELKDTLKNECSSLLHLVQAVFKARMDNPPKICLATRGAVQVDEKEIPNVMQSPLWAMTGVLEHEHPELGCTRIDLDPNAGVAAATQLLSETYLSSDERRVAFRGPQRFVARLVNSRQRNVGDRSAFALRPDATYLITGGLGGLGRLLARWAIEKGAKHIMLLGRSAPSPEVQQQLDELQKHGATITTVSADVSDPTQLQNALSQIDETTPLRGVFHCPVVLDDGIIINQTWQRFETVLRPKVDGAWNLHTLTRDVALDFFVLFSSAASLFGNPGQANYAAGNGFLDSLAHFRRAQGMAGLSINWGIWSNAGGVAERQLAPIINATGVGTITPEEGLRALERLLPYSSPQVAMIRVDWPTFLKRAENWRFIDDFRQASTEKAESTPAFIQTLGNAPGRERRALLLDHIRSHVDNVLCVRTPGGVNVKQGFFEMGMDSLTAVELKNNLQTSLGCKLPSTVAFECPTIEALVDYLTKESLAPLFVSEEEVAAEVGPANGSSNGDEHVTQLSEEEVNRLMDEKLETIETFLQK